MGVELEQLNWDAVQQVLKMLVSETFCGRTGTTEAHEFVNATANITEAQRAAFIQMIRVRENIEWDFCVTWRP